MLDRRTHLHTLFQLLTAASAAWAVDACGGSQSTVDGPSDGGTSTSSGSTGSSSGASSGGSSSGASGSSGTSGVITVDGGQRIDPTGFASVCNGTSYKPLGGLKPGKASDYLGIQRQGDAAGSTPSIAAEEGTKCATAADKSACTTALGALRSDTGWVPTTANFGNAEPAHKYLVRTQGDTAEIAAKTFDELAAFLAPIDTPNEAALLVTERGYFVDCSAGNVRAANGGYEVIAQSGTACGEGTSRNEHLLSVGSDGKVTELKNVIVEKGTGGCAIGRRFEGMAKCELDAETKGVAAFLSEVAYLEAASVFSFERLALELRAYGAPSDLVRRAEMARLDEVRHARLMTAQAERYGGTVPEAARGKLAIRGLLEIAMENAVEGCVRETFGALTATVQAQRAQDATIRGIMERVAIDETNHAALAWDVAEWLRGELSEDEQAQVKNAMGQAMTDLRGELRIMPASGILPVGLPSPAIATQLFDQVKEHLWNAA